MTTAQLTAIVVLVSVYGLANIILTVVWAVLIMKAIKDSKS